MKLTKKKGYEGTIRNLLAENLLTFIDGVSENTWMFIPPSGKNAVFGDTRDAALFDVE